MADQSPPSPKDNQPRSPFAGCLILIVMGLVVLVLISSAGWALKKQSEALATFTDHEPRPTPVADPLDHEAEFNSFVSRIGHFKHELENERPASLALSPTDLNLAIAQYDALKSFRGQLSITAISPDEISGRIHLPLNSTEKLPSAVCSVLGIDQRPHNLNGTFTAEPTLTDGKLILTLTSVTPTQGALPKEFLQGISRLLVTGDLAEDSPLHPILKSLTAAGLQQDQLVFSYVPGAIPPSAKEQSDELADNARKFAALGAVILILTMILAFILISRWRKARRSA
ncbi:MAG: hypothetical protein ACSHYF_17830 [Verrucomicrobiaceae bacterium]